jgi:hypothetical protein
VQRASENIFLRDAALSGLGGRELPLLERLLARGTADDKFIGTLAQCVCASRKVPDVERLLALAASSPNASAILDGILATAPMTAKKPLKFQSEPEALKQSRMRVFAR